MTACPQCQEEYDSEVALRMHVRAEHPGALALLGSFFRRLRAEEKAAKPVESHRRPHPALEALFRNGCPCGKSYTRHMAEWRAAHP